MARVISGVYQIVSPSGKRYIGSSRNVHRRWTMHRYHLKKGCHHSKPLQRASDKYGVESLRFEVLEECAESELLQREQWSLDNLRPEYNAASVCDGALTSPEVIEFNRLKGRKMMNALHRDPQFRSALIERASRAARTVLATPEARQASKIGIRIARSRAVVCIEIGVIFPSVSTAARLMGLSARSIHTALRSGEHGNSAFHFRYADSDESRSCAGYWTHESIAREFDQAFAENWLPGVNALRERHGVERRRRMGRERSERFERDRGALERARRMAEREERARLMRVRCVETGTVFENRKAAGEWLRTLGFDHHHHISECVAGKRHQAYGYRWERVEVNADGQ